MPAAKAVKGKKNLYSFKDEFDMVRGGVISH